MELTRVVQTKKIMQNIYISHVFIFAIFRFSVWMQDSFYIISDTLICVFWKRNQNIFFIKNINAWKTVFKVNNRNSRTRCEICSKLTIKTYQWWPSGVFIVNLEHISHLVLMFLFLTLGRQMPPGKFTHLKPMLPLCTHWKHQKSRDFVTDPGVIEK